MKGIIKLVAVVSIASYLTGCGGEGEPTASTNSLTVGVITGFGSVYVNGVEYETYSSSFSVDGASGSESDLEEGMVIALCGSVNPDGVTGEAVSITFSDDVEGYVLDVTGLKPDGTGTINVMGQNLIIDTRTLFESYNPAITSIGQLAAGHIVEVSGYSSGAGDIYATRIEVKTVEDEIELKGVVTADTGTTFTIGSLVIDYSSASQIPSPLDGLVEVKINGMPTSNGDGTYSVDALYIERESSEHLCGHDSGEIEIEGVVTSIQGLPESFELNGEPIIVGSESGDSDDDDYIDPARITVGMRLEVEGYYNADGILVADEIEEEESSDSEIQGTITAIDLETGVVTVGTQEVVIIPGQTIMHDSQDDGVTPERYFDISDLMLGDYVEVYYDSESGVAIKLEREDSPSVT